MRLVNRTIKKLLVNNKILLLLTSTTVFLVLLFSWNFASIHFILWKLSRAYSKPPLRHIQFAQVTVIKPHCPCLLEHIVVEEFIEKGIDRYFLVYLESSSMSGQQQQTTRHSLYQLDEAEMLQSLLWGTCDIYNVLRRGKHQRVVSYSIYGSDPIYLRIIEENLANIRTYYPGFSARFYYDNSVNESMRCHLECTYPSLVDFCNTNRFASSDIMSQLDLDEANFAFIDLSYMHKMMWRFLPLGDSFVDVVLSRDTDSFVTQREADAVNEWLASSSNVAHIMRGY